MFTKTSFEVRVIFRYNEEWYIDTKERRICKMSDHDTIIIDEDQNQDFREVDLETVEDPKEEVVTVEDSQDDKEDDYEKVLDDIRDFIRK